MHARRAGRPARLADRDPGLARALHGGGDPRELRGIRAGLGHEADHRQRSLVDHSPAALAQPGPQQVAQPAVALDLGRVPGASGGGERHEHLQADEAPGPLRAREIRVGGVGARHVAGGHAEGAREVARVAGEKHARAHRRREPLVGVDRHGVGPLDPLEQRPQPLGEADRARPSGVDVEVQAELPAEAGDRRQRVDDAPAVVPAVATTKNGRSPAERSRSTAARSASTSSLRSPSDGDTPRGGLPEPRHAGRLDERVVRLAGDVERGPLARRSEPALGGLGEMPLQGDQQSREVRLGAAAREAARRAGQAEAFTQEREHVPFDRHRGRRVRGHGELGVEGGHEGVREHSGEGGRRVEQAEVAGVRGVHDPLAEQLSGCIHQLVQRHRRGEVEVAQARLRTRRRRIAAPRLRSPSSSM